MPPSSDVTYGHFARLLNLHRLGEVNVQNYVADEQSRLSQSSTVVSTTAKRAIDHALDFDGAGSDVANELQACLENFVDHLDNPATASRSASSTNTTPNTFESEIKPEMVRATKHVGLELRHQLSGEIGLTGLQKTVLIDLLNRLLDAAPLPVGSLLQWRLVGVGEPGKPDVELIYSYPVGTQRVTKKLAVMEIKTIMAAPSAVFATTVNAAQSNNMHVYPSGTAVNRVYVVNVNGVEGARDIKASDLSTQLVSEMATREASIGILQNHNDFCGFIRTGSQISVLPLVRSIDFSSKTELWKSPLGLLLGLSLLAYRKHIALNDETEATTIETTRSSFESDDTARGDEDGYPRPATDPPFPKGGKGHFSSGEDNGDTSHDRYTGRKGGYGYAIDSNGALPKVTPFSMPPGFAAALSKRQAPSSPPDHSRSPSKRTPSPTKPSDLTLFPKRFDGLLTPPVSPNRVISIDELGTTALKILPGSCTLPFDQGSDGKEFRGPLALVTSSTIVPKLSPNPSPKSIAASIVLELTLAEERGRGSLWQTYSAYRSDGVKYIVKICDLYQFSSQSDKTIGFTTDTAREAICREATVLHYRLSQLQGVVTPTFHGLMGSVQGNGHEVWTAIVDDGGFAMHRAMLGDSRIWKSIQALYAKVHAAGVLHNDIELRHIVWTGELDSIRLIDFDQAIIREDGFTDEEWARWCQGEVDAVLLMLGAA